MPVDFTAYVPKVINSCSTELINEPVAVQSKGCVLVADLTGFTALTQKVAKSDLRGAEKIQQALNSVFDPLVECVEKMQGDIIAFPGDAAIAFWTAEMESDEGRRAAKAAIAAQEMPRLIGNVDLIEDVRLHLKIALTAGDLQVLLVGGRNDDWFCLLNGKPLSEVSNLLDKAQPGEIVCSDNFPGDIAQGVQTEKKAA